MTKKPETYFSPASPDLPLLKNLLTAEPAGEEYLPRYQMIMRNLVMMIQNKRQSKILEQLALAELDVDLMRTDDGVTQVFNGCSLILCLATSFVFKRWSLKFVYFTACVSLRIHLFEPILCEYKLRYIAKQNTALGQEIRNLFRFYYEPDEQDINEMTEQCRLYLKMQEVRKEFHRKGL